MPTKDFRADLQEAAALQRHPRLSQIKKGDYEGSISFKFHHPESGTEATFVVVTSDVSDYPATHSFLVFIAAGNEVPSATRAIERAQDQGLLTGISINEALNTIDGMMCNALNNNKSQSPANFVDTEDESDSDYGDFSDDGASEGFIHTALQRSQKVCRQKLRTDVCMVKEAGFRAGFCGEVEGTIIVSISRRVSRLGISEEALKTWNVLPSEYLVLLIRYSKAYQNMQDILIMHDAAAKSIEMRVGLCTSYKPTSQTAINAFQAPLQSLGAEVDASNGEGDSMLNFRALFIGSSIKRLLNERLLGILKLRKKFGISWTGAELLFQATQGKHTSVENETDEKFNVPDSWLSPPPSILTSDHFAEVGLDETKSSFLLIAWQFTLRHFVKCTEFCLICHCKTFDEFEALKPYVCSNGLCLYQYITYGMGPSLEYEIQSQSLVVDFLISLTYARAMSRRLEDFPTGLGIRVPSVLTEENDNTQLISTRSKSMVALSNIRGVENGWLHFPTMNLFCHNIPGLSIGSWIVIVDTSSKDDNGNCRLFHCQVESIGESLKDVHLSQPVAMDKQIQSQETLAARREVGYVQYDQNFDDLTPLKKQRAMTMLLDTLPDVTSMKRFLGPSGSQKLLTSWHGRVIPAALDILRWIVASNRSSILQDSEDRNHLVTGMQGFVQFRLVQGAPDKEQRFIKAVKSVSLPEKPSYPTIFAWHGSPVYNWHSILREGLHFKQIAHGRACGNGVYMSSHFNTAMGYSGESMTLCTDMRWPNSTLDFRCVLSLNEIVNKTDAFVCYNPHFVVQNLDWIQPRYLFVGASNTVDFQSNSNKGPENMSIYEQDPKHQAYGPDRKVVAIPISAFSSQRRREIMKPRPRH